MKLRQIKISDFSKLKPFFRNPRYRLCEYSLSSILAWTNDEYQPYGMINNDALIIGAEFKHNKNLRHLMLPISPDREFSPEELYRLADNLDYDNIWFVPDTYIETFGRKRVQSCFKLSRQKEYDDYVYLSQDLVTLAGNKYSKKRNLINQFMKEYGFNGSLQEVPLEPSVASESIAFLEKWCEEHDCDVDHDMDLACEKQAAINTIENIDTLEVKGLLLRINGEVCAFAVASQLTEEMGVLHFEKAFSRIKGLYQYFDNLCAKRLLSKYKYINKESDMNIPGLAKAKKSYHPVMMVRSYQLKMK